MAPTTGLVTFAFRHTFNLSQEKCNGDEGEVTVAETISFNQMLRERDDGPHSVHHTAIQEN